MGDVEAREHAEVCGAQLGAGCEHHVTGFHITGRGTHVVAAGRGRFDQHAAVAFRSRALDHHDGIGPIGHRRTGHDPNGLAGTNGAGRRGAGRKLAHHLEPYWMLDRCTKGVLGAHRVPIHRGVGERWHGFARHHLVGEHQAVRGVERDSHRRDLGEVGAHQRARGVELDQRDYTMP